VEEGFGRLGLSPPEFIRSIVKKRQISRDLTWEALEESDKNLCSKVKAKAAQYGYALDSGYSELNGATDPTYTKILSGSPSI
jgi:hypothetical protein